MTDVASHWESVYEKQAPDEVSWFEPIPRASLELIEESGVSPDGPLIDAGGGESHLAGALLAGGYTDITVIDVSVRALDVARAELGEPGEVVTWIAADVLDHDFGRRFDLWHDRAVFHFMVDAGQRDAYLAALRRALSPGGQFVVATFGPEGPTSCSGLPVQRYGARDLARLLPDFELASDRTVRHRTPSGKDQQFLYARFVREGQAPGGSTGSP